MTMELSQRPAADPLALLDDVCYVHLAMTDSTGSHASWDFEARLPYQPGLYARAERLRGYGDLALDALGPVARLPPLA